MNKTKISDSTSKGIECWYFSTGNKTGWKIYRTKDKAVSALATQKWAYTKDIAPKILSGVQKFALEPQPADWFCCPVSNRCFYYDEEEKNYWHDGRVANCNTQNKLTDFYGFLTEEVDSIGGDLDQEYCLNEKLVNLNITDCDFHGGNWGMLNNKAVFIDFGSHFTEYMDSNYLEEIEALCIQTGI